MSVLPVIRAQHLVFQRNLPSYFQEFLSSRKPWNSQFLGCRVGQFSLVKSQKGKRKKEEKDRRRKRAQFSPSNSLSVLFPIHHTTPREISSFSPLQRCREEDKSTALTFRGSSGARDPDRKKRSQSLAGGIQSNQQTPSAPTHNPFHTLARSRALSAAVVLQTA